MWPEEGFSDWITLANSMKASGAEFVVGLTASADEAVLLTRAMPYMHFLFHIKTLKLLVMSK